MPVLIPDHIRKLVPYRAGKPMSELKREQGLKKIVKLASNENPIGPSSKAMQAVRKALRQSHRYPDPSAHELVLALAKRHKRPPEEIFCGSGIDSIIGSLITAFSKEGDEVLTSEGTFIGFFVNTNKLGRKLMKVPLQNYHFDLAGIQRAITPLTRMIILANPNNPTGTYFSRQAFENFMRVIPERILVFLDEAYFEYAQTIPDYPNGFLLSHDNLLVARTFSKCYGLAGLRVAFCCGPRHFIRELYKVKLAFEPNNLATAAAIGALKDESFLKHTLKLNRVSLEVMRAFFDRLHLPYIESVANFLLLLFPDEVRADHFVKGCLSSGLIVRPLGSFGIPHGVRINSGTMAETRFALKVIEKVYQTL